MKFCATLLAVGLLAAAAVVGRAADARFSQTLTLGESAEAGLSRLSSDQVAVLDALLRRDLAGQSAPARKDAPPTARFSQRLTADERRIAGLTLLTEAEVAKLDTLAERQAAATSARALLSPLVVAAPAGIRLRPAETKAAREIHGSFSLSMGWGKGGYSERTGAVNLNYEDPARGFAIAVGYSETHLKGGPGVYLYRDPVAGPPPFVP
jgi:hypothetical protein